MASETLTKAVQLADHLAFRQIAHRYLKLRGYAEVQITDGRKDGGADLLVRTLRGNRTPLAVAISTQAKDLKTKLRSDCEKAKRDLGLENVHFLSSHRLANAEITSVLDDLWDKEGIRARTVDCQEIATVFEDANEGDFLLKAIGLDRGEIRPHSVQRPDFREEAAYAFAIFGDASENFRNSVAEQTVLVYLVDNGATSRDQLETNVTEVLQLSQDQAALIGSAIDRMLQQQRVRIVNSIVVADPDVVKGLEVMRALRERQWKELLKEVEAVLADYKLVGKRLETASDAIMSRAGALVIQSATAAGNAIGLSRDDPAPLRVQVRKRLREITADLASVGLTTEDVGACVETVARVVANSGIGHILMAGELFLALTAMQTNEFERAFGAAKSEIYLDASVAIPMITALLYEPADSRFSKAALRIFEMATARGIALLLPKVYLEEAAAHLMEARDWYPPLMGDPDLRYSTNAYVAHFADLRQRGSLKGTSFETYTERLGYVPRTGSQQRQVDVVAHQLGEVFERYNIRVIELDSPEPEMLRQAQEAMTFTANDLRITRHGRLLDHDTGVVAHFMESEVRTDVVRIFCTWDRLHLQLHTAQGRALWQPLDPVMLGDVIVLSRPESREELLSTVDVAIELTEEEGLRGAAVLDGLVRIEKDNLFDADLMELARGFKEPFLQARRDGGKVEAFAEAWSAWKSGERELIQQTKLTM